MTYTPADSISDHVMPVLFIGHGSPMNAIEDNEFSRAWAALGQRLPRPQAILCISAHWQTQGTFVTAMDEPRTIYDFYGFPQALYELSYPAPGHPQFASLTRKLVHKTEVQLDQRWGLDHGAWCVLHRMYPQADVPVYQMSLDGTRPAQDHYELAQELQPLRRRGILIVSSGNIVHNLMLARPGAPPYDWAVEFDQRARVLILEGDYQALIDYPKLGRAAQLSVPTNEHYLPLLYALALQEHDEQVSFACEQIVFGSISMRAVIIGD